MEINRNDFASTNRQLRVAFSNVLASLDYDPAKIHIASDYIFLENVMSPLVEIDRQGSLVPGLAESYEWVGNELHLKIRIDQKTVGGIRITPEDVVFSLKRLLVLASNTHGNFKDIVCPDVELRSVDDLCPGILLKGQDVVLVAGEHKDFLLPMLASIDFAILPKSSVDQVSLKILNFRETSGPYYVDSITADGSIKLSLNQGHYHASKEIANEVLLVPFNRSVRNAALELFDQKKVDHVMTINQSQVEDLIEYSTQHTDDVRLHTTMKIRSTHLVFTDRGISELSQDQRTAIGASVRAVFQAAYAKRLGYQETRAFFPSLGAGGLEPDQARAIEEATQSKLEIKDQTFRLALLKSGDYEEWARPLKAALPAADIYREDNVPDFKTYAQATDFPHAFIASVDTGFREDIGLISHTLSAGYLGMSKKDRAAWLATYMALSEKTSRMQKLRDLHFQVLRDSVLVPLVVSPFVALVRKPWRLELSDLYANNQLWLIKHD